MQINMNLNNTAAMKQTLATQTRLSATNTLASSAANTQLKFSGPKKGGGGGGGTG